MNEDTKARRAKRLSGGRPTAEYLASLLPSELSEHEKQAEIQKASMAPPGGLPGVTGLLEQRRLEYGIPDHMFDAHASFGFVMVHQITRVVGNTYGESKILLTEVAKDRETKEAPRGIIVSAGLDALDKLRSNGIDLGHIVMFSRSVPYRASMGFAGLKEQKLIILQVGDIFSSEDTATMLFDGQVGISQSTDEITGFVYHYYNDADGKVWKPMAARKTANV